MTFLSFKMLQFVFRGTTPIISILEPPILSGATGLRHVETFRSRSLGMKNFTYVEFRTHDPIPTPFFGLSPISLTNPIGEQYLSEKQQAGHMWISFSADEAAANQRIIGMYPPVNQSRDTLSG